MDQSLIIARRPDDAALIPNSFRWIERVLTPDVANELSLIGCLFPALRSRKSPQNLRSAYLRLHSENPICADLVSLQANLDNLVMGESACDLSDAELDALNQSFSALFPADDEALHLSSSGQGVLSLSTDHQYRTSAPHRFCGRALRDIDAKEPSEKRLRTLEAELQMVLHDHPVNLAREQRGLVALNAVWFWGGSAAESRSDEGLSAPPAIHAADITLRGLWETTNDSHYAESDHGSVGRVLSEGGIVVLDSPQTRDDLKEFLESDARRGRPANLLFYACDGQLWKVAAQSRLRQWLTRGQG